MMADPKIMALVDYLLRGYHRPGEVYQTPPEHVPRMSSEDYRTGQFLRSAPTHLPPAFERQKALALALMQPTRSASAPFVSNFVPVED
jgi:hypothetical protein